MNRPTFRDFRVHSAAYAGSVGSPLGICVNNAPALAGLVNIGTEQLINDPDAPEEGWWGGWGRFVYNVTQGVQSQFITTQRGIARLIVMDVCNRPRKIQNGFYEFLDYGEGLKPPICQSNICGGQTMAYDRETVATLGLLNSTPQFIRVFPTDSRDVGRSVILQGTDQNGNVITSTDPTTDQTISGEIISLALPFAQSVNQYSNQLTGIEKDWTFGSVTFQQVDPISGTAVALSSMEPSETAANYRRYFLDKLPCSCAAGCPSTTTSAQIQVTAMAKLEYIPIASDPDYLGIPNVPALIAQCEFIRYSAMDNVKAQQLADKRHSEALKLLFGQLTHYLGNERPAISVSLFGKTKHHGKRLQRQPI